MPYTPTQINNRTKTKTSSMQPYYANKSVSSKSESFVKPVIRKKAETNQSNSAYPLGVSVCISAWKTAEYIEECLDSVANQTWFKNHDNWEILLGIDGCEETLAKVKEIMHKYKNLKVMMMDHNVGTYVTCNTIIKEANYEWILRFDSDDIMYPEMVETFLNEKKDFDYILCKCEDFPVSRSANADGQAFIKTEIFLKYGGYLDRRCGSDSEFKIRTSNHIKQFRIDKILFKRRQREDSLTSDKEYNHQSAYRNEVKKYIKKTSPVKPKITIKTETYNVVFDNTTPLRYKKYNGEKTIISLTTWKKRINHVYETIDSLLNKCKNSHIVLVLSSEEFPEKEKSLPRTLKNMSKNIEILWVRKNTKAFKKVIPTMMKYKNVPIISADDDLIYLYDYATELYGLYMNNKECATVSYRHSKMITNCGAATLYNPAFYSSFIGYFNPCISNVILEDDMFMQYVIDKNGFKQYFKQNTFPFKSIVSNAIDPLSAHYKNEKNPQERKKDAYNKINAIINSEIVVNITTWKKRDWCLYPMLKNLKNQTLYPNKIVLWLAEAEYDRNNLPETIKKCINEKLLTEIKWVKENTKGHKRYDCFKYFNNCYNILLDDDILYKPDFIKELVEESKKHQNCITVYSSRSVEYVGYTVKQGAYSKEPSHKNQFIAGRCCFPPHIFPFEAYENESLRNEYVMNCDESWYRPFFIKNDIKIHVMYQWDNAQYPIIGGSQTNSLWNINRTVMDNGMRDKERNFYNAIKISHMESECKKIWPGMKINDWVLQK